MWSRSQTLGEITRGDRDDLKSIVLSNSRSMDDLRRRPLRAKFPSVTDLIAFYDSCDGGDDDGDDDDDMSARSIKRSSVSELHILGGVSFDASKRY